MTIIDGLDELLFKPVARISESRIGGAILLAGYMVLMGLLAVAANL